MTTAATPRHVLITGASGFIARHLTARLRARGDVVTALARGTLPDPHAHIDAVVNLAGAPILGPPWTAARRRLLRASRIDTTQALVTALAARTQRPAVLVSASADDMLVPVLCSERLAKGLANATLDVAPWGGHAFTVTAASAFNERLVAFLAGEF